jgi:hypothetical protein
VTVQEHFIAYCRCRETVKLFRFLLSPYSLIGTCNSVQNCIFMTVQEHFIAYCKCRGAVKLFRFLLSPYSLIGTCNSVQNCTFRWPVEIADQAKIFYYFKGSRYHEVQEPLPYTITIIHLSILTPWKDFPKYQLPPHLPPGTIRESNIYISVGKFGTFTSHVVYLPTFFLRRTQEQIWRREYRDRVLRWYPEHCLTCGRTERSSPT